MEFAKAVTKLMVYAVANAVGGSGYVRCITGLAKDVTA